MPANAYHFITTWRIRGTVAEVRAILSDAEDLPRWWPSVYLGARVVTAGGPDGVGSVVELYSKGWLPYTLRWCFEVLESRPDGSKLRCWGDFRGTGVWTWTQDGDDVVLTYDWNVVAEKPLFRVLSALVKPLFAANHHWAMARGEESLRLEIARRHAIDDADRARIPPPPPPTFHRAAQEEA